MTDFVKKLQTISGLLGDEKARMFVTSQHWGLIADEIKAQYKSSLTDENGVPTPKNFQEMVVGKNLWVINAGTEDQEVVNTMNALEVPESFAWKRENLRTG